MSLKYIPLIHTWRRFYTLKFSSINGSIDFQPYICWWHPSKGWIIPSTYFCFTFGYRLIFIISFVKRLNKIISHAPIGKPLQSQKIAMFGDNSNFHQELQCRMYIGNFIYEPKCCRFDWLFYTSYWCPPRSNNHGSSYACALI